MIENNMVKRAARLSLFSVACLFGAATFSVAEAETPRINLQNTDVRSLVEVVSRLTGKNFVIDPQVGKGSITFVSGKGLSEEEFYEAFLSILQVHGLEAIEAGNIIKIVPLGKARSQVAPIYEADPTKPAPKVDVDETITQVFKLQYIPVATAVQTLTPLAGQGETRIQFNQSSNSVIVTGRGQNVSRLAEVIRSIDQPDNKDFELIGLKFSVASQLAQTLRDLLGSTAVGPEGVQLPQQVRISVDERTNSILVAGDKSDRERVRSVIARLDIPRTQPGETQVVPLKYAVASQLIQTLKELQVGSTVIVTGGAEGAPATAANAVPPSKQVRMAADERTNSILISGQKAEREQIVAAIAKLDIPRSGSGGTRVIPLRYAKAEDLVKVLNDASKGIVEQTAGTAAAAGAAPAAAKSGGLGTEVSILADKTSNSIILSGPAHIQKDLLKVVYQLDRRRGQVLVEAIIAEVSNDLSSRLGFGVAAMDANVGKTGLIGTSNFGGLNTALQLGQGTITSLPSGLLMGVANGNFGIVMDALKGDGATNILSTPTILTMDNEEAKMVVGQNVPFVTGSYASSASGGTAQNPFQTIERKDVGLTLKVTPQINRGKTIQMKISQEASSVSSSGAASDLITNKRSIDTNVMVEDGQILVLGGLIQDNFNDSESKVPILSDIPVIGEAFKQNSTQRSKQNLMVFIHPVILPDREAADAYSRSKYHTLQRQQQQSKVLQRGRLGAAAVFPDIECFDCKKGSVDSLHFPAKPSQKPITQRPAPPQPARPAEDDCVPGFCQINEK
ncbi:general secretion pathway protein D [Thiothrix eikelboomii]|uniref:General secretion pathway protein D n=1 Tax=Thiothrix eikelboomii TaxID=92487 RepID=A0A1T4WMC2_9GAMM|nr:type II secretion system secretin GspD [Thiothrix eikelboomii]SKA78483.1 general secretion pathway protein D [Thiothrix eikelboomii]